MRLGLVAFLNRLFGYDIFISYSSADRPWAIAIEKLLRLGKYRVFRDDTELHTGQHLDRLIKEVRRSTMLMVLVTDHSMQSDWVHRELTTYCERPRPRWRIAPVFLDNKYPRALPERFRILADFHGVLLPGGPHPVEQIPANRLLLTELTSGFRATRHAAVRSASAGVLALVIAAIIAFLIWRGRINTQRDAFLKNAEVEKVASRFDLAEADLARAWNLERTPAILAAYRDARARRVLERPTILNVVPGENVLATGEENGEPYVVLHASDDSGAIIALSNGRRTTLAQTCGSSPEVAVSPAAIVWTCGNRLYATGSSHANPTSVKLPAEPEKLRLTGLRLEMLFREGGVSQLGVFQVPELQPLAIDKVEAAPEGGEMGFCPDAHTHAALWSFSSEDGRIAARRWQTATTQPSIERFEPPPVQGVVPLRSMWISRVIPSTDCERFFVEYAPFTLERRSVFEMLRIRLNSPRPVDRFDSGIDRLAPAPDVSGLEAVYLTANKELRAFLLTSPVVLTVQTRTLAERIQRMTKLPGLASEIMTVALDNDLISIFRNADLWTRLPSKIGDPVRAVPSANGHWLVLEGDQGAVLWRRAQPWNDTEVPSIASIIGDTSADRR